MQFPTVSNARLEDPVFMQSLHQRATASLCWSDADYLKHNPDVSATGLHPFVHCCRFALRDKRTVSAYLDPAWYHQQYCGGEVDCNPVAHFFTYGVLHGLKGTPNAYSPASLESLAARYFAGTETVGFGEWPWKVAAHTALQEKLAASTHFFFIAHEASRSGAALSLLHVLRELAAKDDTALWTLVLRHGELDEEFAAVSAVLSAKEGVGATRFPMFMGAQLAQGFAALPGKNKCLVPNTVTVPKFYATLFSLSGIPAVPWIHELPGFLPFYWENNDVAALCREAAAVMVPSRLCRDRLVEFIAKEEPAAAEVVVGITGNPIDLPAVAFSAEEAAAYRTSLGLPESGPLVVGCGTVSRTKGADIFADTAALAAFRGDVSFVWAGGATTPEDAALLQNLRRMAEVKGLRLFFPGRMESVWPLYAVASLLLCTSRIDTFPRIVAEAKSAGLPVVCLGNNNGAVELLSSPADAVLYTEEPDALLRAVLERLPKPGEPCPLPVFKALPQCAPKHIGEAILGFVAEHAFARGGAGAGK